MVCGAQRHRAHRLHAAQHVDLVRAAQMHGGDDGRVRRALHRRRRGDDARHARHRRGQHRHVRRGDHRELAAGHVAADRLHRDVAMTEDHARQGLDLDIGHRGALRLGEGADLVLGKADVLHVAGRDLLHRRRRSPSRSAGRRPARSSSNFALSSRTAASPRVSISSSVVSTMARTLASSSARSASGLPRLRWVMVMSSSFPLGPWPEPVGHPARYRGWGGAVSPRS